MNGEPTQKISFAEFELDAAHRRLLRAGKTLPLSAKAFDLLVFLAENAGRVVTKNEILDAVWANQFVEEANLKVQMPALRKVLGERKDEHCFLVTIPGKGYKFVADIRSDERELVIESRRFSRLVVEDEISDAETPGHGDAEIFDKSRSLNDKQISSPNVYASPRRRVKGSSSRRFRRFAGVGFRSLSIS
jgi:DNA-binding winged helix-turn-helix (wHTH) protein